jgi:LPXTG-motif cell wall-anchored protein
MAIARRILITLCTTLPVIALLVATAAAQTSTATTQAGAATVTTEQMSGEVVQVEGNNLIVKMSDGELRTFSNVPDSRKAIIDGKEVGVRDLKPGTRLTATITKTSTPVTVRTTTVGTGKVWYVMGNNVILTLPSGENKQYTVKPDYKFNVNGRPATVSDLRPGMTVSAEKIVEEPKVEIALNTRVAGQAPAPQRAQATSASAQAAAPAAAPAARAQAATLAPRAAAATQNASAAPATLPKTGSQLPLVGLLGLLLVGSSFVVRMLLRSS